MSNMPTQPHTTQKRSNVVMGANADPVIDDSVPDGNSGFRTPQNRRSRTRKVNGEGDPAGMRSGGQLLPSSSGKFHPTNSLALRMISGAGNAMTPLPPNQQNRNARKTRLFSPRSSAASHLQHSPSQSNFAANQPNSGTRKENGLVELTNKFISLLCSQH